jgi:hypothetical protein
MTERKSISITTALAIIKESSYFNSLNTASPNFLLRSIQLRRSLSLRSIIPVLHTAAPQFSLRSKWLWRSFRFA